MDSFNFAFSLFAIVLGLSLVEVLTGFPSEFGDRADFDEHYMQHRWQVVGAITICDAIEVAPVLILRASEIPARVWIENALQFSALLGRRYICGAIPGRRRIILCSSMSSRENSVGLDEAESLT